MAIYDLEKQVGRIVCALDLNTEQLKRIAEHLEEHIKIKRGW